jgi:hypothetical protein
MTEPVDPVLLWLELLQRVEEVRFAESFADPAVEVDDEGVEV